MKIAADLIRRTSISVERRTAMAALAGVLLLGIGILFLVPPLDLPFAPCVFHTITGHSCLMCGMTRSLHALLHGEFMVSIRYHLFGPVAFLGMFMFFLLCCSEAISGEKIEVQARQNRLCQALMAVAFAWVVYWGIRLATEGNL